MALMAFGGSTGFVGARRHHGCSGLLHLDVHKMLRLQVLRFQEQLGMLKQVQGPRMSGVT